MLIEYANSAFVSSDEDKTSLEHYCDILSKDFALPTLSQRSEFITLLIYSVDLIASAHLLSIAVSLYPSGIPSRLHEWRVVVSLSLLGATTAICLSRHLRNRRWWTAAVYTIRLAGILILCCANSLAILETRQFYRVLALVGAVSVFLASIFKAALLRSFGLFGPLWPGRRAPKVIPHVAIAIVAFAQLCGVQCLKIANSAMERSLIRETISLQISTFATTVVASLVSLNIAILAVRKAPARRSYVPAV